MVQYQPRMGTTKETPTKLADPQKAQHREALETLADWSRENAAAEHTNQANVNTEPPQPIEETRNQLSKTPSPQTQPPPIGLDKQKLAKDHEWRGSW